MLNKKEHYDLMAQFERDCANIGRFDKEPKDLWKPPINAFYQDGQVNQLFLIYRKGYAFGKCVERQ